MDDYRWVPAKRGIVPAGAQPNGARGDGEALWLIRLRSGGETHVGNVRRGSSGAMFLEESVEEDAGLFQDLGDGLPLVDDGFHIERDEYEVLMDAGSWVAAQDGEIPQAAYVCGLDFDDQPVYAARAQMPGAGRQLGWIRPGRKVARFGHQTGGISATRYEVLVAPGIIAPTPVEAWVPEFEPEVREFAGLPVVSGSDPVDPVDPTAVAWLIERTYDEDSAQEYEAKFLKVLDRTGPAGPTAVILGVWGDPSDSQAPIGMLVENAHRLPNLRALFTGDISSDHCALSGIHQGDIGALLEAFPALETLRVRGASELDLRPVRHPALTDFVIETDGLDPADVRAISESDFPRLSRLELWLGTARRGGGAGSKELESLLSGRGFPALTHLGLRTAGNADEIAAAVATAPIVARLTELDLSGGTLGDDGARALSAGRPLTHLRSLNLSHHFMTGEVAQRMVDELPGVEVDIADAQEEDEGRGRFTAGWL